MPTVFTATRTIPASPDAVWSVLTDWTRAPEWLPEQRRQHRHAHGGGAHPGPLRIMGPIIRRSIAKEDGAQFERLAAVELVQGIGRPRRASAVASRRRPELAFA